MPPASSDRTNLPFALTARACATAARFAVPTRLITSARAGEGLETAVNRDSAANRRNVRAQVDLRILICLDVGRVPELAATTSSAG